MRTPGSRIEKDGDLFGSTVILASRIAAQAGSVEIWPSSSCERVVERGKC